MTPCQEHIAKLVIREYVKGYLMEGKKPSGGLRKWFKEKWVDISRKTKSGGHPACGASAGGMLPISILKILFSGALMIR